MGMDRSSVTVPKPPKRNVIRIKVGVLCLFQSNAADNMKSHAYCGINHTAEI